GEVDGQDAAPVLVGSLEQRREHGDAGIVDEGVEPAEAPAHRGDRRRHRIGIGDVAIKRHGAVGVRQTGNRAAQQIVFDVEQRDAPAIGEKPFRHGEPDAACGAGDKCDFLLIWRHAGCPCAVVPGRGSRRDDERPFSSSRFGEHRMDFFKPLDFIVLASTHLPLAMVPSKICNQLQNTSSWAPRKQGRLMSLKLYFHPLSSFCWKALIALYENDTSFTPQPVNLGDASERAALLKLWPIGKFPVLRDDAADRTIPESSIIIEYLDERFPGRTRFIPADPKLALQTRLRDRF